MNKSPTFEIPTSRSTASDSSDTGKNNCRNMNRGCLTTSAGFLAYSKINPFSSSSLSGIQVQNPSPNSMNKINPFSSPSPIHNPFMSLVNKQEDFWSTVSKTLPQADHSSGLSSAIFTPKMSPLAVSDSQTATSDTVASTIFIDTKNENNAIPPDNMTDPIHDSIKNSARSATSTLSRTHETLTVMNGEEGEICLLQVRARLYRLDYVEATFDSKGNERMTLDIPSSAIAGPPLSVSTSSTAELSSSSLGYSDSFCVSSTSSTASSSLSATGAAPTILSVNSAAGEDDGATNGKQSPSDNHKGTEIEASAPSLAACSQSSVATLPEWVEMGTGPVRILAPSSPSTEPSSSPPKASDPGVQWKPGAERDRGCAGAAAVQGGSGRLVMRRENQPGGAGERGDHGRRTGSVSRPLYLSIRSHPLFYHPFFLF